MMTLRVVQSVFESCGELFVSVLKTSSCWSRSSTPGGVVSFIDRRRLPPNSNGVAAQRSTTDGRGPGGDGDGGGGGTGDRARKTGRNSSSAFNAPPTVNWNEMNINTHE